MFAVGILLIAIGAVCLVVPSVTFFTQKRVADVGFFQIDVSKPHTIFLNPAVGIIAIAVGAIFLVMAV